MTAAAVESETKEEFDASATWQKAGKLVRHANAAGGKVKLENKIGSSARHLDIDHPLRIISLASQRALSAFSKPGASDVVDFEAVDENSSPFEAKQPAFTCRQMFYNEFKEIRQAFGISERQFYAVLSLQENQECSGFNVIFSGDASGKSPSFFFLSPDQRFILKSCTKRDTATLSNILHAYRDHVKLCSQDGGKMGNSSLLPRYIGLYQLEFNDPHVTDVTLVVMTNFFAGGKQIHKKYDLKGSTYNRIASEKERQKKSPVFKDLDWMAEGKRITFPTKEETDSIIKRFERDALFLRDNNLIDYSLLVGIHEFGDKQEDASAYECMNVLVSRGKTELRYFGIVDILTPYVLQKKAETIFTGTLLCRPGISCKPPQKYMERFMDFLRNEVLSTDPNE